ncbi:MAG: ribosomal protein L7/L12 [Pirellulales bacterium]|nr:ribosomal protein L7/L12 [Pirellulales bacterium]
MPTCPFCNESNPAAVGVCKKCGGTIPLEEPAGAVPSEFDRDILSLMKGGKKIEAIKLYREKTGLGLKDAKDAVEALAAKYGIQSKGLGCASVLLLVLVVPMAWRLFG